MKRTYADDVIFGKQHEDETLPKLSVFGDIIKLENRYEIFDYKSKDETTFIELKTRTNAKDKYLTTMISQSKVNVAKKSPNKKFIFCFKYTDGLYYIPYEEELFNTFEISQGGRYDRGRPELNSYCYIPVDKLIAL